MGEYVLGIIGAAAVIGIMENIVPQNGKTKSYMRLITALCLLCLVVKPLGSVLDSLPALFAGATEQIAEGSEAARDEYEKILEGEITDTVREQLRAAVKSELESKFKVENCEVGIALGRVDGELRVQRTVITLMGRDIFKDPYTIEEHFGELLECECMVVIG